MKQLLFTLIASFSFISQAENLRLQHTNEGGDELRLENLSMDLETAGKSGKQARLFSMLI